MNRRDMTIEQLLEWIWAPIVLALASLWTRVTGLNTRLALLEQAREHQVQQREEDRTLRDQQREELLERIDTQTRVILDKLEHLEDRINSHETA